MHRSQVELFLEDEGKIRNIMHRYERKEWTIKKKEKKKKERVGHNMHGN